MRIIRSYSKIVLPDNWHDFIPTHNQDHSPVLEVKEFDYIYDLAGEFDDIIEFERRMAVYNAFKELAAISQSKKIERIKNVRLHTNCGLKDARDIVEGLGEETLAPDEASVIIRKGTFGDSLNWTWRTSDKWDSGNSAALPRLIKHLIERFIG